MAEAAKDQDQSMEDILRSIKRIIAEEGDGAPPTNGSDVLELTEMLADDGSITKPDEAPAVATMSIDEIMAAPISSLPQEPIFDAPEPTPEPPPAPVMESAPMVVDDEPLISDEALDASIAAMDALKHIPHAPLPHVGSAVFRSGTTVEDLVIESLKPMLKDWLDHNLPGLVERLVEREIHKLRG